MLAAFFLAFTFATPCRAEQCGFCAFGAAPDRQVFMVIRMDTYVRLFIKCGAAQIVLKLKPQRFDLCQNRARALFLVPILVLCRRQLMSLPI
jgi:hypothetical protein